MMPVSGMCEVCGRGLETEEQAHARRCYKHLGYAGKRRAAIDPLARPTRRRDLRRAVRQADAILSHLAGASTAQEYITLESRLVSDARQWRQQYGED